MPLEIQDLIGIGNKCGGGKLYVTTFAIVYVIQNTTQKTRNLQIEQREHH
jgi:hypothetical protein